jgi:DNA-binding NarL/FixJ family response regulator
MPIRVLIVHANPILVSGLRTILEQVAMEVVGEAVEWEPLVALMHSQHPDVVLLDGSLPSCLPGYEARNLITQLRTLDRRCGIFVLDPSPSVDEKTFFHFFKHGAMAYEPLTLSPEVLVKKVRLVASGECLMVFAPAQSTSCPLRPCEEPDFPPLSQRELDVLRLIAKGFSNAMVGVELEITDQTVKNHVSSILGKFDACDRTAAVVKALLCKLISLDEFDLNDIATKKRKASGDTPSHPSNSVLVGL